MSLYSNGANKSFKVTAVTTVTWFVVKYDASRLCNAATSTICPIWSQADIRASILT